MTRISVSVTDLSVRLEVNGHSGYAESGKDIVCSAVSILTYTVAQLLFEMNANDRLSKSPTVKLCEGDSLVEAECKDTKALEEAMRILHFAKAGYSLLQNSYPEYVKFVTNSI